MVNETGRDLGGKAEATADVPPRRLSVGIVVLPGFTLSALSLFSIRFVWQPTTATKAARYAARGKYAHSPAIPSRPVPAW